MGVLLGVWGGDEGGLCTGGVCGVCVVGWAVLMAWWWLRVVVVVVVLVAIGVCVGGWVVVCAGVGNVCV